MRFGSLSIPSDEPPLGRQILRLATASAAQTEALGAALAAVLEPGDIVALNGTLGAGKTAFTRGVARGLGVPAEVPVTSPTFALLNVYEALEVDLHHFDLYRLESEDDLEAIGYRDFVSDDSVAVVEWAEQVPDAVGPDHLRIDISGRGDERAFAIVVPEEWGDRRGRLEEATAKWRARPPAPASETP